MSPSAPIKTPNHLAKIPGQSPFEAQALSMIVALASELVVMRARLDTSERLLAQAGILSSDAIENFSPDAAAQAEREQLRQHSMNKIFRAIVEASEADLASFDPSAARSSDRAGNE